MRHRSAGAAASTAAPEVSLRASRAKPTSRADWKRSAGSFSRHRRTMRSSDGGSARSPASMGGSACRIAASVSAGVTPAKGRRPPSIS